MKKIFKIFLILVYAAGVVALSMYMKRSSAALSAKADSVIADLEEAKEQERLEKAEELKRFALSRQQELALRYERKGVVSSDLFMQSVKKEKGDDPAPSRAHQVPNYGAQVEAYNKRVKEQQEAAERAAARPQPPRPAAQKNAQPRRQETKVKELQTKKVFW